MLAVNTSVYRLADLVCDVLCTAQAFEWSIMINMIMFQDGKMASEIMYLMSEKSSRDKFRSKEKKIQIVFYVIVVFLALECVVYTLVKGRFLLIETDQLELVLTFKTTLLFVMLALIGTLLISLMKKKYNFAYQNQKQ